MSKKPEPEKIEPKYQLTFAMTEDGQFALDCPESEYMGRYLLAQGMFELDRFYVNRRLEAQMKDALARGRLLPSPEDLRRLADETRKPK